MNKASIRLSAQRALLFAVFSKLRTVSLEVVGDVLFVRACVAAEPTHDERDMLFAAAAEIAGDFADITSSKVDIVVDSGPLTNADHLAILVFATAT